MIKRTSFWVFLVLSACFGYSLKADVVILNNGQVINGNILEQDASGTLIQLDYGTFRYPKSVIKEAKREPTTSVEASSSSQRIPNWSRIISALATNGWQHELKQIPATVIDNGVLKDVPYISFRCNSGGYEINIYGDLDRPSGVEIGAVNYLVNKDEAKSNCVNFICSVLSNVADKEAVHALHLERREVKQSNGMTFEITQPDEPDAYGGWWVSAYDEVSLAKARASAAELLAITQPRVEPKSQPVAASVQPTNTPPIYWTASDLSYSRPAASYSSGGSGGGRVFVRAYTRKDGTYVHSYTRSSPHRRR